MSVATLVLTALSSNMEMNCPSEYIAGPWGACLKQYDEPKGWYSAELACRKDGGHLLEFADKAQADMIVEAFEGTSLWLGLTGESGEWRYSSNDIMDAALQQSFNTQLKSPIPGTHCAVLTEKGIVLDKCFASHVHVCQVGVNGCVWKGSEHAFDNGPDHYVIGRDNIVTKNSEEIGIGEWYSHDTFRLAVTSSTISCNWVAKFSISGVQCGCDGSLSEARWNPPPSCSFPDFTKDSTSDHTQVTDRGPNEEANGWGNPTSNVPSPSGPQTGPTEVLSKTSPSQDGSSDSLPLWMWPLAFVAVAGVSTVAAFGVLKSKKRNSQDSGSGDDGSLGHQMMPIPGEPKPKPSRPCDICRKFNESTARQRLQSVHDALTKELSMPLVVSGTRCDHVGGEHIHVFNVENEFDSHTLGALSTVYSRTKPRLPRNTRIHILHKKERQKLQDGSDFAADHVYIADAYY